MISERDYLEGFALWDAIFNFGSPELIEAYNKAYDIKPPKQANGVGAIIQGAIGGLLEIQNQTDLNKKTLELLKRDILAKIKSSQLIACGYKDPRNIEDSPIKIPIDICLSGDMNWDTSELKYKALEFSGIRLLNNSIPEIPKLEKVTHSKKSDKLNFAELNPEKYTNEKEAAELLGIAVKTLQGYRVKGGGPEFSKFGPKMVRYKIGTLQKWAEDKKRKNTSGN